MDEQHVDIIFNGELLPGTTTEQAKRAFANLFKLERERVEEIFLAPMAVLKKDVDQKTAKLYQRKLAAIGVQIELRAAMPEEALPATNLLPEQTPELAQNQAPGQQTPTLEPAPADSLALVEKPQSNDPPPTMTRFDNIEPVSHRSNLGFSFTGDGGEFFRIWVVNVVLSILTLGVYSAWAKVRTQQYFYGNTWLDDNSFEYHAKPLTILKGRAIALFAFMAYVMADQYRPELALLLLLIIFAVFPWLLVRAMVFRTTNTSYRNIRFGFNGTTLGAAKAYIFGGLATVFSLGLFAPYMVFMQKRFVAEHLRYGSAQFEFSAGAGDYYGLFMKTFGVGIAMLLLGSLLMVLPPVGMAVIFLSYLVVIVYWVVAQTNLFYNAVSVEGNQFVSNLEVKSYLILNLVNLVGMLLTLGLFYPWARVRMVRYRLAHLTIDTVTDMDSFTADQQSKVSAVGDEVSGFFDLEIAF